MMTSWEDMPRHEQLAAIHYDLYKEVHNVRPRWMNYEAMTEAELEAELNDLQAEGERVWAANKARQARNLATLSVEIEKLIVMGAGDRATALRWMDEAQGSNGDADYFCFLLDLPYGSVVFTQQATETA
jgi:hypothetical protein